MSKTILDFGFWILDWLSGVVRRLRHFPIQHFRTFALSHSYNSKLKTQNSKLFLLILLFLLVACGSTSTDSSTPATVAQKYLEAVRDSNYSAAYDLISADSQLKISKADFSDRLTRAARDASLVSTRIVKVNPEATVVGKRASITYQLELTLNGGQTLPQFQAMVLLQQDNGWRVVWP